MLSQTNALTGKPNLRQTLGKEEDINTFLAESIVSDANAEALETLQRAILTSRAHSPANEKSVRYLHSFIVPGDGLVVWLYEALDPIDIRDIYEANELPFTRIVEVTELIPSID